METEYLIGHLILLTVTGISAWTDLNSRRIPNKVMFFAYIAALLTRVFVAVTMQLEPLIFQLLLITAFLIFFIRGMLGGGDLKLFLLITFIFPNSTGLKILVSSVFMAFAAICLIPAFAAAKRLFLGQNVHAIISRSCYTYPYSFSRSKPYKMKLPMALFAFTGEAAIFITALI